MPPLYRFFECRQLEFGEGRAEGKIVKVSLKIKVVLADNTGDDTFFEETMQISKSKTTAAALGGVLLFLLANFASAGPLDFLKFGHSVDADPKKEYLLKATDGPWMIFVATFSGPTARQDANTLVFELRKQYKFNAVVYDKEFVHDLSKEGKPQNPYARKSNFKKKGAVLEYAVLVGNFQSVDDADFQKTLHGIKECYPDCIKGTSTASLTSPNFSYLRTRATRDETGRMRGPLYMAFACVNPMLPPDDLSKRGTVDDFIVKINADSPYSLLNCKKRYTVKIATFTGKVEIQQDRIQNILDGRATFSDKTSNLEIGGRAAARLAAALRAKGYEAYEFHDRGASYVTVGGFDDIGYELPNGMTELQPEIADLMNKFRAKPADPSRIQRGAVTSISYEPVTILDIECDPQPQIIEVPKRRR